MFAYNTAIHTVTHQSPYYLNHGREPRSVVDRLTDDDLRNNTNTHVYAHELASKLFNVHQRVTEIYEQVNDDRVDA